MTVIPVVAVKLTLDDGSTFLIKEGDLITNLQYQDASGKSMTITGTARVINLVTSLNSSKSTECPPEPYFHKIATVNSIILDISDAYNAKLRNVQITSIISIGSVETPDPDALSYDVNNPESLSLSETLSAVPDGGTLLVSAGDIEDDISIDHAMTLKGAQKGMTQNFNQEV